MKVDEDLSIIFFPELKGINKQGTVSICARITIKGQRSEPSLSIRINPKHWDPETNRISSSCPDALAINGKITEALAKLKKQYTILSAQFESVSAEMLKKAYKGKPVTELPEQQVMAKETTIMEAFTIYVGRFSEKVKSKKRSNNTLKKWNTTRDKMEAFIKYTFKKNDVPLSQIKPFHAEDMYDYFLSSGSLGHNSAMKYIRNTRQVFKFAIGRWIPNNPFTGFICNYIQPGRDILSMPEIKSLYHHIFFGHLEKARDCFLFSCFTGLAYQELALLSPSDIVIGNDGYKWVSINSVKTGNPENVPLLPIAEAIVNKYDEDIECVACDKLLPVVSNQKYNDYLKVLAGECNIDKYITTHTGRHTFATTICLENGVPIETVSKMLGHSSLKMTQIYAKITTRKTSDDMQELRRKLLLLPAH
jgi:site-specific recombinase XerD